MTESVPQLPALDDLSVETVTDLLRERDVVIRAIHDGQGLPMEHAAVSEKPRLRFRGAVPDIERKGLSALDVLGDHLNDDDILCQWVPVVDSERFEESEVSG